MTGLEIDETLAYSSSGVGDDDGIREYPFITNPQVLEINRKLNELHRKILFQDFFTAVTNQDYDNCPKGSCMSSHFKTNVPGPYFSCPVLHESGDDFFPLPFPKRSARPKVSVPLLARGNKAKRYFSLNSLIYDCYSTFILLQTETNLSEMSCHSFQSL